MIDKLEIVRGQRSVLYGSDAIGATVNALTRGSGIDDYRESEPLVDGRILYRWSSGEDSHVVQLEVAAGGGGKAGEGGKADFTLAIARSIFGTLSAAGLGELSKSRYNEWGFGNKIVYRLNPDTKWTLAYQRVQQNYVLRTLYAKSWRGTTVGNEQRRELDQARHLAYSQLELDAPFAGIDRALISLSRQRHLPLHRS